MAWNHSEKVVSGSFWYKKTKSYLFEANYKGHFYFKWCFPGGSEVKASACNAGDLGSIPESGRSLGEGNGYPLQCSCQKSSMDRGAWWATVHGVTVRHNWAINTFHFHLTHQLIDRARSFLCSEHQGTNKHLQTRLSFFPISIYSKINT